MNQTEVPDNISHILTCGRYLCRSTLIMKYLGIYSSVIAVPTAAVNALVIVAILTTSSLRTPSYLLLTSLAFTDLVVGLLLQPLYAVISLWMAYRHTLPFRVHITMLIVNEFVLFSAVYITAAISVDRYLALRLKMRYRSVVTIPRTRRLLLLIWVAAGAEVVVIINIKNSLTGVVLCIVLVTTCLLIIVFSYTKSFRALKIHCARTQPQGNQQQPNSTTQSNGIDVLKYRKLLNTMIIIVLLTVIFTLPFYALVAIYLEKFRLYDLNMWIILNVSYQNSLINPAICIARMRDLRQSCRQVLRRTLLYLCWK